MPAPGKKPEFERPRRDPGPEEEPHNHLDKSGLDLKNSAAAFEAMPWEETARSIARLPLEGPEPSLEEQTPLQAFGAAIGALRRKLGLSVAAVAASSGLTPAEILSIEVGAAAYEQVTRSLKPLGQALGNRYPQLSRLLARLVVPDGGES